MANTAKNVLDKLRMATNINNINNKNNKNNSTICRSLNKSVEAQSLRDSLGLASLSASQETPSPRLSHPQGGFELPDRWKFCKWDLFNNAGRLKLVCNIILKDQDRKQRIIANLNSPHDRVWRKVSEIDRSTEHWQMVKNQLSQWRSIYGKTVRDFMVSKFYLPSKQGSIEIVAFMHEDVDSYYVRMIYRAQVFDYIIQKSSYDNLSAKQLAGNQIATLCISPNSVNDTGFISLDELGI